MVYFQEALSEINSLRQDLGESEWTNRELRMAVKEKSVQVKIMIAKIAKVERMLVKEKKGQGKVLTKKQKIIGELEKVDMLGMKMEMLSSDDEDH